MENKPETLKQLDNAVAVLKSKFSQINVGRVIIEIVLGRPLKNENMQKELEPLIKDLNIKELKKEIAKHALRISASPTEVSKRKYCDNFVDELELNHVP